MGRLSLRQRRLLARGINPYSARRWPASVPFLSLGIGNRATVTLGTGNSRYTVYAKQPGTGGNAITFRVVVAGANTAASVGVTGNAVTFNSATNGSSAATSTVRDMVRIVEANIAARTLIQVQRPAGSDGLGVVAAVAATSLTGAT